MSRILTHLHRFFGLCTAVFLFIAGLTGAVIAWDHEVDEWLNPQLYRARSADAPALDAAAAVAMAERVEASQPRMRVGFVPLTTEPGGTLQLFMSPRFDPSTGEPHEIDFNQVAVDPATGQVQATRMWGEVALTREGLLPFLYKLHYTLHLPDVGRFETGMWLMGIIALVWVLDCLIALYISFPSRRAWRKSFAFRFRSGPARLNFDLHRSGGVWLFPVLLVLAVTAVSMNLGDEVMRPLVSRFSTLSANPFVDRPEVIEGIEPVLTRAQAIERARAEATRRGITAPAGGVSYSAEHGFYSVGFYEPENDHGDGSLGNPWLFVDGRSGQVVGADIPGEGSAGDIFMQAQFPLHSGRIAGAVGRTIVCVLGLLIAMLSATGVIIWVRRRKSRQARVRLELDGLAASGAAE